MSDENVTDQEQDKELRDQKNLEEILRDKVLIFILQKLRQGPIQTESLRKLVKAKFKKLSNNPQSYLERLIEFDFIREYEYTKDKADPDRSPNLFPQMKVGDTKSFFLLTKDFYAIRKPPATVLSKITSLNLSNDDLKEIKREMEVFFNKYTTTQSSGDDPTVIDLFSNDALYLTINLLSSDIVKLDDLKAKVKDDFKADPEKIMDELLKKKFLKIVQPPNSKKKYALLMTDIEVKALYPEYLLRNFNQKIAEKEVDKDFALKTLGTMRKYYLELEKPEILQETMEIIEDLEKSFESYVSGDKKKAKPKKVKKIYTELRELYSKVGLVDKANELDQKYDELLKNL